MFKNSVSVYVSALVFTFVLVGCGSSIEGVYSGKDEGFLDQLEFKDDQKVELMFMGTIREGTFEIEDDRIRINNAGEITILTIQEDGCLEGGGLMGRYCKGEGKSTGQKSAVASSQSTNTGSDVVGASFAFGPAGDEWIFEFLDNSTVRMTLEGDSENLSYVANGNEITIRGVDGNELVLVQRGNDLEGGPEGMVMRFARRGW